MGASTLFQCRYCGSHPLTPAPRPRRCIEHHCLSVISPFRTTQVGPVCATQLSSCYLAQTSAELLHHTQTLLRSVDYSSAVQYQPRLRHSGKTVRVIAARFILCLGSCDSSMGSCDSSEEASPHNGSKDLSSQSDIQATKQSLEALTAQLETQQKELNQAMVHAAASLA